jgi:hypothetical protein
MQTVHVRISDAADGKPTPCRVRFTDGEGRYYAPLGRLTDFAVGYGEDVGGNLLLGGKEYAYIDGACEVRLPPGPIRVEASKGFEYKPIDERLHLAAGKLALRFDLERWADLRGEGWYSGDAWAHFLPPHAALLEAAAEDVAVVNLLALETVLPSESGRRLPALPNILAFSGQAAALERPGHLVAVNTLNEHPVLGRLALLHCHRAVYPLRFGGDSGPDDWTLADWCDQCHRKGGLVIGHDFFTPFGPPDHNEVLADLLLGRIDALEMTGGFDSPDNPVLSEWHTLLDAGYRVPLVGGGAKADNRTALGGLRTYARLRAGEEFSYRHWIEAVRAGRAFVSNGPLLSFTVNGEGPGGELHLPSAAASIDVRAEARSLVPFDALEVVRNGAVVAQAGASAAGTDAVVETVLDCDGPGWLAARCWGPDFDPYCCIGAQTSPVYVLIAGETRRPDAAALVPFFLGLDRMLEWVAREARCDDKQRQRLAGVFEAARQELLRRQGG